MQERKSRRGGGDNRRTMRNAILIDLPQSIDSIASCVRRIQTML